MSASGKKERKAKNAQGQYPRLRDSCRDNREKPEKNGKKNNAWEVVCQVGAGENSGRHGNLATDGGQHSTETGGKERLILDSVHGVARTILLSWLSIESSSHIKNW